MRRPATLALLALLSGCASSPPPVIAEPPAQGAVGATLIAPAADTRRMDAQRHQRFIHPNLDSAAMPVYPEDRLALRLEPVVVCVDAVIDAEGLVPAAVPRVDADCAPPAGVETAAFVASALDTVRSWTYAPALLCVAPEDFDGDDPCLAEGVIETPTAVRLSYAFRFSQSAGTPQVERLGAP